MPEKKQDVSTVIIVDGEKFLILKRSDKVHSGRGFWNFPGGSVEPGESLEEGGARELKEEAGLDIDPSSLEYISTIERPKLLVHTFLTTRFSGEVKINYESSDFAWVNLDEIDDYLFVGGGVLEPKIKNILADFIYGDE